MEIKCIVIDDEKLARDLIIEYISEISEITVIGQCAKGSDAIKMIDELEPHLIFLDVQMPSMTGFDVLDTITHEPYIIFSTAYDQYAIQAFEKNAIDYLLKPIDKERFKKAVERAVERIKKDEGNIEQLIDTLNQDKKAQYSAHIFVQKSEKLLNLAVEDIIHLEASGDYSIISATNDQFVCSTGISKLAEKLDPSIFIRIHRSTIININKLKEIEKHFNGGLVVKMENGKTFPVSRTYTKALKGRMV
ncbi:MAG: LytTR family transcriptional regulator DNA-binding domain-containing protein [Cyclobacteriaceae bacterium]|nr:LytTR family transcriptional regulator DNA-binding domain-containing protein [Cyclobacteriaceae bacterium]